MRFTRCDGPTCKAEADGHYPHGEWIMVEANEDGDHGQFCSWSCLASWATNRALEREPDRLTA